MWFLHNIFLDINVQKDVDVSSVVKGLPASDLLSQIITVTKDLL